MGSKKYCARPMVPADEVKLLGPQTASQVPQIACGLTFEVYLYKKCRPS